MKLVTAVFVVERGGTSYHVEFVYPRSGASHVAVRWVVGKRKIDNPVGYLGHRYKPRMTDVERALRDAGIIVKGKRAPSSPAFLRLRKAD